MNQYDQMIFEGKHEEFELMVLHCKATLEDLSEITFEIFKSWVEAPKLSSPATK